ncbi:MAG: 3-keto-5-aminohexanoate cleavage protein [Sneathiella sp.]
MTKSNPLIVTVAPNGARKTKKDHPGLPITPEELAEEGYACQQAGASMIHLHVRDDQDTHSLDVGRYRAAMAAVHEKCGDQMLIQVTTEAVGLYSAEEQMAVIRALKPQSASLAIRELVPSGQEDRAREFFQELTEENTLPHYILYSDEDLARFNHLVDQGVIPQENAFLLFVLGRYSDGQVSSPADLLPFLNAMTKKLPWSVCAFGPLEHAAASAAVAMGGHVRVGFENNLFLKTGEIAPGNADLVAQIGEVSRAIGRPLASANEVRSLIGG